MAKYILYRNPRLTNLLKDYDPSFEKEPPYGSYKNLNKLDSKYATSIQGGYSNGKYLVGYSQQNQFHAGVYRRYTTVPFIMGHTYLFYMTISPYNIPSNKLCRGTIELRIGNLTIDRNSSQTSLSNTSKTIFKRLVTINQEIPYFDLGFSFYKQGGAFSATWQIENIMLIDLTEHSLEKKYNWIPFFKDYYYL